MDIPQRLPCPEKRSDKISKTDMRYLNKLQKTKSKAVKREQLDAEITEEKRNSERRSRASKGTPVKKQTKVKIKLTHNKTRKRAAPEMQLLQKSREVIQGQHSLPCILVSSQADSVLQYRLSEEEIRSQYPKAIIWKESDYPNIIPHDDLWVFCNYCHLGMPSTQLKSWTSTPMKCYIEESKFFDCALINHANKFLIYHDSCIKISLSRVENGGSTGDFKSNE